MTPAVARTLFCLLCLTVTTGRAAGQQVADTAFKPPVTSPAYPPGAGPVVCVDHAHVNFHRIDQRYGPFTALLRRDGYVVTPLETGFTATALVRCRILVIANALAERNREDWSLPTPSAFLMKEIEAVSAWVDAGGSLLLIADHMPFPGAATDLAAAFGVQFSNGFTFDSTPPSRGGYMFRRSDGSLARHPITTGRTDSEGVDSVVGGVGSGFQAPGFEPLLTFGATTTSLLPTVAWQFSDETPAISLRGWLQGAVRQVGRGRVAVFGEASMFTAQLQGPDRSPMGMNQPAAQQNPQFLLNLLHWLSGPVTP